MNHGTPCMWHDSLHCICVTLFCTAYVWHDSLLTICVTWLSTHHMSRLLSLGGMIFVTVWHGKHRYTKSCARKILMCVVDSSHRSPCVLCTLVWHEFLCDVTLCVSWMLVCDMNVCVWHECLRVTWILPIRLDVWYESLCDMTLYVTRMLVCDMNAYMWHGFFPYMERWGAGVEYHFQEI